MVKSFTRIALAVTLIGGLGYNTYAVVSEASGEAKEDTAVTETTLVSVLLKEQKESELTCEQMVARIDEELVSVDLRLDENPVDDSALLELRRDLVELRLEQPCHSDVQLTQIVDQGIVTEQPVFQDEIIGEEIIGDPIITEEFVGGPISGGSYSSGGGYGGGGGGGFGGGGLGRLLPLAGLAGLAGLDNDDDEASMP